MEQLVHLIVKFSLDYSIEKYGEVIEQSLTHLKCKELLRPEDIKGKNYLGGRHVYCGDRELYRSSTILEISIKQVKNIYQVCTLQDYHNSKGFLLRQTYDQIRHQFTPELAKVCLCLEYLNPDLKYFTCNVCRVIYHNSCVGEVCPDCKLPIKRQPSDISETDSLSKVGKNSSRADNSLPLDIEKYKNLSENSKRILNEQIKNTHLNYMAMQGSLTHEEKTRQQIISKIKCALFLAAEEIKEYDDLNFSITCIESLAISIEAAIYFTTGSKVSSQEYSKKIRSIIFNLSAEKNQDFRGNLLRGYINPKDLCKMQSKDMASSEIKNFRQERQKVYTKEQLILPNSSERLVIKTHKGEAVFDFDDKIASDEFSTNILDVISKKRDNDSKLDTDDDPFNPNNYDSIEVQAGIESIDVQLHEIIKEWTPQAVMNKIKDRLAQYLIPSQSVNILCRINTFNLNKSS